MLWCLDSNQHFNRLKKIEKAINKQFNKFNSPLHEENLKKMQRNMIKKNENLKKKKNLTNDHQ